MDSKKPFESIDPIAMTQTLSGEFWAVRGKAMQVHASLEQAICTLIATTGQIPQATVNVIFYKITSSRARSKIIDKLVRARCGTTYAEFLNSAIKLLEQVA